MEATLQPCPEGQAFEAAVAISAGVPATQDAPVTEDGVLAAPAEQPDASAEATEPATEGEFVSYDLIAISIALIL